MAKSHWLGSCDPGGGQSVFFDFWVWISNSISFYFGFCSWIFWDFGSLRKESGRSTTQAVVKVYFLIFGFGFPIQPIFILDFVDFLGLWKFEKGEWEKNWVWVSRHLKIFVL